MKSSSNEPRTLKELLQFWFKKKKYTRKKIYFSGKMRRVIAETLDYVELEGITTLVPKTLLKDYGIFRD